MTVSEAKAEVCRMAVEAWKSGLFEGTCGNLSYFERESGQVIVTPSTYPYDRFTPEDMVVIDLEGNVLEGHHRPTSEWPMHTDVYKTKPEVNAVIHTHSTYATAMAVMHRPIPLVIVEMVPTIGGDVPLAPFAMTGTPEMGDAVRACLEKRKGCLLENHGVLAIGEDIETAMSRAYYIENAAKVCVIADSAGGAVPLNDEQYHDIKKHFGLE